MNQPDHEEDAAEEVGEDTGDMGDHGPDPLPAAWAGGEDWRLAEGPGLNLSGWYQVKERKKEVKVS